MKLYRHGFTLIELIASVVMCSVMAGLALPVVQQSREDTRLMECANKMATIAVGSAMYEDANGRMPPWSTGPGPIPDVSSFNTSAHQNTGAVAYILPFIGEQELFDLMPAIATDAQSELGSNEFPNFNAFIADQGMSIAYNTKLDSLICPSNADYSEAFVERLHYAMVQATSSSTQFSFFFSVNSTGFGRTSYLPSIGGFIYDRSINDRAIDLSFDQAWGAMRNRLTSISANSLGDGASNTILWGESLGTIEDATMSDSGQPELVGANFSLFSMGILTGDRWLVDGGISFGSATGSVAWLIGSMHPDGSNVAMSDGSIRFIDRGTSRGVMTALGCGNDGWLTPRN